MLISIPGFGGLNLALAPQRLQPHEATVAIDADFRNGDLRGIAGDTAAGLSVPISGTLPSLFFRDGGNLVGSSDYADFVRSPAFYADSTLDTRVFYATLSGPPRILTDGADITAPTTDIKLGVPKPGTPATPIFQEITGKILGAVFYTNKDALVHIEKTDSTQLKVGGRVTVSAPGFVPKDYVIRGVDDSVDPDDPIPASLVRVTLGSTTKKWVVCTAKSKAITASTIEIHKAAHGLLDGDQVILSLTAGQDNNNGRLPASYNTSVWEVAAAKTDTFELTQLGSGATFATLNITPAPTAVMSKPMRFAKLIDVDNRLTTASGPKATAPGGNTNVNVSYAADEATWENSAYSDTASMRAYVITFVNSIGDESEPSLPTDAFLLADGLEVTFKSFPTTVDASYFKGGAPRGIRIYRTDMTGQWRLIPPPKTAADQTVTLTWAEATAVTDLAPWKDTTKDAALAEPLSTTGWAKPPTTMCGLVSAPGGVIVGYTGKTVCPSVPYAPYAYPLSQQVSVDYTIVGLVVTATGVCILTTANPYVLVGSDPSGWGMVKLETNQACVSHQSIVDMGGMGIYASPDGLVGINGADVKLLTQGLLTREQWQGRYNPTTIVGAWAEDKYIGTYVPTAGGIRQGFVYDPQTNSIVDLTLSASAMAADYKQDKLIIWDGVFKWFAQDQDKRRPYTWHSKWFTLKAPNIFGWGQIMAPIKTLSNFTVTIEVWSFDGMGETHVATYSNAPTTFAATPPKAWALTNVSPFRLPVPNDRYSAYQVKLSGTLPLSSIHLANVMDELKEVGL